MESVVRSIELRRLLLTIVLLSTAPAALVAQTHQHDTAAAGTVDLFPSREGSGTAWLPDETPMFGEVRTWRGWTVMLHGTAFAQFLYEPADPHRTGGFSTHQFGSTNWGMAHARRALGSGWIGLRAMGSLEPWTLPGCGYISMLATGEVCDGDTIHDRQHPHDLFMELAAEYDRPLRGAWRWQIYGGLAGEPALGPAAFPHRPSALANPIAPIAHHWLDSSHISFGVVTAGVYDRRWKLEASVFNGREPDDHRAGLDLAPLDSFSGRISFLPNEHVAIQISAGHLEQAEFQFAPQPRGDVNRSTASVTYHRRIGAATWASTAAYGVNGHREIVPGAEFYAVTQAMLLESSVSVSDRHTWFGRAEIVEKPAEDLHAHEFPTSIFTLGKLQIGYVRQLKSWKGLAPGIGGTVSMTVVPDELASRYGGRTAGGFGVFLLLHPPLH